MNSNIPDEAVEAALSALFPSQEVSGFTRAVQEPIIRTILEAAGAHMLAGYVEAKPPEHQCEPWQLQANGRVAFRPCSACGENQE